MKIKEVIKIYYYYSLLKKENLLKMCLRLMKMKKSEEGDNI